MRILWQARALSSGARAALHDLPQLERSFDSIKRRLLMPQEVETRRIPSMSLETVSVATMMKKAKGDPDRLKSVLRTSVSRLLTKELMSLFWVFVRAKEMDLAELIFGLVRKESWYKPQASLYLHLITAYSERLDSKAMERIFQLLDESEEEGLIPNVFSFQTPIQACVSSNDFDACMRLYNRMHASTCRKDVRFYMYLTRKFEEAGLLDEAQKVYEHYLELRNTQGLRTLLEEE
ncbi:hypothetical protein SELMODRAFT_407940 [Selaginella moellendorffii]|uniref:Pentacotripeptide-repeat region of PRORP domain-containing protein n=1 Tax=Selaginella moellendorffii TaxID=88036 RepID=D8R597_SELML|nr:pentatricopeptide repeat-containing protein At3g22670, mitochondrial isoform X2 [Selaginella moellendorffii]EFJ32808.1 hypothetical protein SELMODRAFT_407940 [Selaginella moellendorffii]|eukprot:XP_002966781.1 pentatricopeptide repeat-containing protein At3g22670, mitochondrial isoform X2 [Selaginella moellendorffii]